MRGRMHLLALVCAVALVTGCTTRIGDLTAASTKNLTLDVPREAGQTEGADCMHQVLAIPFGTINPTFDGAIDKALEAHPTADALEGATFYQDILFTLLYNRICIRATGTPVKTR